MGILLFIHKFSETYLSIMKLKEIWINLKRKDTQKVDINLSNVADQESQERNLQTFTT